MTLTPTVINALRTIPKGLVKGLKELKIGGRAKIIQTVEISQNTEKSPGDLFVLFYGIFTSADHLMPTKF